MLTLNIPGAAKRHEPLCPTCVYAVTMKGFNGEEVTSCGYGGGLRELKFAVSECSVYIDRHIEKPRRVAGFVRSAEPQKPNVTIIKIA